MVDAPKRGTTVKAGQRGFLSLSGRGFGQPAVVGKGAAWDYSQPWDERAPVGITDGGHSWLTVGQYRSKALSVVKPHEQLEPLENDHPLRRLLENPNPWDTWFDIEYELGMFEGLCGVSYEWLVPNRWGVPCERWCLPSHWVWPRTGGRLPDGGAAGRRLETAVWDPGQEVGDYTRYGAKYLPFDNPDYDRLIQYYEVRPWGGMGSAGILRIPSNEVIMTRWKSPINKIDGYSKLAAIAQWIDSEESITRSRWSQFINQARPEFWLKLGPGYEDPTEDTIARIEAKFAAKLQGELNYGRPIITPPGAEITPLSFNPTEMAYFQCLSEDTECLTADGWKRYDELTTATRIACYDRETGMLVYQRPTAVHVKPYRGVMHRWQGQRIDALMTPNHRTYVRRPTSYQEGGELVHCATPYRERFQRMSRCRVGGAVVQEKVWDVLKVEELAPGTPYGVLAAAPAAGDGPSSVVVRHWDGWRQLEQRSPRVIRPEVWLRFLGYYLSEGCLQCREVGEGCNGWEVVITQKKHVASFAEGLAATPFAWKTRTNSSGCTQWRVSDKGLFHHLRGHCGEGALGKRLPAYVKAWPAEFLRILLDALLEGDGSARRPTLKGRSKAKRHTPGWNAQYYTSSKQLADDVMEIAVKCGYAASLAAKADPRPAYAGRMRYRVNIASRAVLEVTPKRRSQEEYDGTIWCVTVPTGLFVVRRNGKAHITGNSEEQIRDMILSTFQVPPAVVGIVKDMTYGSVLATLAQFCEHCINPILRMRGMTRTKHLASRWDEPGRRVRLWFDDCVPADPAQVNADVAQDLACFLPGQELQGRVQGGSKAWYAGDAVEIRGRSGAVVFVTPNHPVLTEEGFVAAGQLKEGDYLLRHVGGSRVAAQNDLEHAPAFVEEVFDTLCGAWSETSGEVASTPVDFHGDAQGFHGKVHVVGSYGKLRNRPVAQGLQKSGEVGFVGFGFVPGLLGDLGHAQANGQRLLAAAVAGNELGSVVGGQLAPAQCGRALGVAQLPALLGSQLPSPALADGEGLSPQGAHLSLQRRSFPGDAHRFGVAPDGDAELSELFPQPHRSDAEFVGDLPDALAPFVGDTTGIHVREGLGEELCLCFGPAAHLDAPGAEGGGQGVAAAGAQLATELCHRFPGLVATDQVVQVRKFHYEGPVYDFESPFGFVVVGGLVVSNCHAITPNEMRALRGRAPYRYGGDDPIVQGPAGLMPLPMNTKDTLEELAEQLAPMAELTSVSRARKEGDAEEELADAGAGDAEATDAAPESPLTDDLPDVAEDQAEPGIAKPNGKPSKSYRKASRLRRKESPRDALPDSEDDVAAKPDAVDEALWQECVAATRGGRPEQLPQAVGTADGRTVVLVAGSQVKLEHYFDWIEGGNGARYEFIPKDEFWLDAENDPANWPFVLYHEVWETRLMEQGLSYDAAHKRANGVERVLRLRYQAEPSPAAAAAPAVKAGPANRLKGLVATARPLLALPAPVPQYANGNGKSHESVPVVETLPAPMPPPAPPIVPSPEPPPLSDAELYAQYRQEIEQYVERAQP